MERSSGRGAMRPAGIGLLVFTVLILGALFWILRPDEHPLALERDVPLCGVLDAGIWTTLVPDGEAVAVHTVGQGRSICELARAPEPGRPQGGATLARLMLTTEADVRYQNMDNSLGRFINNFVTELKADGWTQSDMTGPWRRTYAFTAQKGESALLIEDDGIFLLISSPEFTAAELQPFALAVTERLRDAAPRLTD